MPKLTTHATIMTTMRPRMVSPIDRDEGRWRMNPTSRSIACETHRNARSRSDWRILRRYSIPRASAAIVSCTADDGHAGGWTAISTIGASRRGRLVRRLTVERAGQALDVEPDA